jgi:ATP-dependent DNA helicase RecG
MNHIIEDSRTELKEKLNDKFEREIISFLNSGEGGTIYIGISDSGLLVGVENPDEQQLEIKDRIKNNILPSSLGLFEVVLKQEDNKNYIQVIIVSGSEKPYYLKKFGMTPEGCFLRVGSAVESMTQTMINNLFSRRTRNSLRNIVSPKQDLTFSQLKIFYEEMNKDFGPNLLHQLDLIMNDGKYNYIGYLVSDNNKISMKVAKYSTDSTDFLIENEEFGYCSIIKATKNILSKYSIENRTFTQITSNTRREIKQVDPIALREAIVNAVVHNDYSNEYVPKFEIFQNKVEISSFGGLPDFVTRIDFLSGFSAPRNKELMRIFRDLELVEQLGTGIRRILSKYNENVFQFYPNFLRVSFDYSKPNFGIATETGVNQIKNSERPFSEIDRQIISLIQGNGFITQQELALSLSIERSTISRHFDQLKKTGIIERVGSKKTGKWIVKT